MIMPFVIIFNNVQINVLRVCYNDFQENISRFVNFVGDLQILIRASYISWYNSADDVERYVRELKLMGFSRIEKFEYKLCENLDRAKFILQQEVKNDNLLVNDDVISYIVASCSDMDIKSLKGVLIKLVAYASIAGEDISVSFAKEFIENFIKIKD